MTESEAETSAPVVEIESNKKLVVERLNLWFWFGLVFGVLPVIFDFIRAAMSAKGASLDGLLGNGEVLISGAAISGAATGELLFAESASGNKLGRLNIVAPTLLICLCNAVGYTQVDPLRPDATVTMTYILFPFTLLLSALCVGMAAKE